VPLELLGESQMRRRRGFLWIAASFAVMLAAVTGGAGADALSIDFESYALGPVWGQNGWTGGACPPHDIEVADNSLHTGAPASFGTKSYRISNAFVNGCFNDSFTPSLLDEAGESTAANGGFSNGNRQPFFAVEFTFASSTGALQPGLNVQVSPDRGDGARMSFVRMRHTATELEFEFFDVQGTDGTPPPCLGCANFVSTVFTGYDATELHTVRLTMQFVDGESNDVVQLFIDDALVHTGGSWEDYYTMDTESSPTPPMVSRTVDSLLIRSSGSPVAANAGNGYLIDDISLESGPVPSTEPIPTCGDPDEDGDNHSNFAPEENEDGPVSGVVHEIDQTIVVPVVTGDGGVVPELNCAVVKGVLGL
jgi:hypothetical protein